MFERNHLPLEGLMEAAAALIRAFPDERVFAFYGKMGAGKTTFIREVCRVLGTPDVVTSPTFAIINEYLTSRGESIFHFDFYRLRDLSEVYDLGYEDYFYSGSYCLIEWPEKVAELLPVPHTEVVIDEDGPATRSLKARLAGQGNTAGKTLSRPAPPF